MRGFILFAILVIAHAHISIAALVIQGPAKPVLENDEVTLECLLSDSELNTSQVHFEKFSKYMNKWFRLEEEPMYRWCIPGVILRREAAQLLLSIRNIHSYFHQGLYRCVADNATATDNSSQPLAITVNYMRELTVYDVSSSSRKFVKENLRVTLGEDVEVECSTTASEAPKYFWQKYGEDWIVPSSKLRLKNVRMEDGGDYTCMAEHPTLSSLKKSSTISITVLPATNSRLHQAWYDSINLVLITSVAGAVLLVMILSITVFLVRRAKQAKNTKGPIDDHSQKKPIYTASVESLPSTCGDKQPLV